MEVSLYDLYYAAREAQILWKKRRQHAQGKIDLHISDDDGWDWDVDECNERIKHYDMLEKWLWKQLPDLAQLDGTAADYYVDSLRLNYDPSLPV